MNFCLTSAFRLQNQRLDVEANFETCHEIVIDFQEGLADSAAAVVSLAVAFDSAAVVPHVRADA